MAAAVRALLRRRPAASPSLALLQPLFPVRHSTPRSPLLAPAAAAVGLPDLRRPQLSPAPAPPLLRYYWSKPSKGCDKETPRLELELGPEEDEFVTGLLEDWKKHPRNLAEALIICKKANALLSEGWDNKTVTMFENGLEKAFEALADCEKALDDFSKALSSSNALSKDTLQKLQMFHKQWVDNNKFTRQELNDVKVLFVNMKIRNKVVEFLIGQLEEDLQKYTRNLDEALNTCKKATALLNEGWDNKTVSMFENGLEKAFEALADREKALDDFSGALSSSNALSKDTMQEFQMFHQKILDNNKFKRQALNDVQALFVNLKITNKVNDMDLLNSLLGQKKPNELSKFQGIAVSLGMCFTLSVMINVIFLHIIRI